MPRSPDAARAGAPHPTTRAEFSRRTSRAKGTVTEACAGALRAAVLPGGHIDVNHPDVARWCAKRKIDMAVLLALESPPQHAKPKSAPLREEPDELIAGRQNNARARDRGSPDVKDYLDYTLRQITDAFGSLDGFAAVLKDRQKIAQISKLEIANDRERGKLIPRELVERRVFAYLDALNLRLLRDFAATAVHDVIAGTRAGTDQAQLVTKTRALLSAELRKAKQVLRTGIKSTAEESSQAQDENEE